MSSSNLLKIKKMSRILGHVIGRKKVENDHIGIHAKPNSISIQFDKNHLHYSLPEEDIGCLLKQGDCKPEVLDGDYMDVALKHLAITMEQSNFPLKNLGLTFRENSTRETDKVLKFVESLNPPIPVKSLLINDQGENDILPILQYSKAGTLEELKLWHMEKLDMSQIVKTDQWKQAKKVHIYGPSVRLEDCFHFKSAIITVNSISIEDVNLVRDALSKSTTRNHFRLNSRGPDSEYAEIRSTFDEAGSLHRIPNRVGKNERYKKKHMKMYYGTWDGESMSQRWTRYSQSIPDSNDYLEFWISERSISIRKKKY